MKTFKLDKEGVDLVSLIIEYESGEQDIQDTLKLFGELVKTGTAWKLQGSYGRTAAALIEAGYLDESGNILKGAE